MAGQTVEIAVCILQFEFGFVVVKLPEFPAVGVVALLALRAELAFMHITFGVAGSTCALGILECCRDMTFFAYGGGVHADEREAGGVVVKHDLATPGGFVVAALA